MTDETSESLLLTPKKSAEMLSIGRATLMTWVTQGWGPAMIDLTAPGRRKRILRWKWADVLAFLEDQKVREAGTMSGVSDWSDAERYLYAIGTRAILDDLERQQREWRESWALDSTSADEINRQHAAKMTQLEEEHKAWLARFIDGEADQPPQPGRRGRAPDSLIDVSARAAGVLDVEPTLHDAVRLDADDRHPAGPPVRPARTGAP